MHETTDSADLHTLHATAVRDGLDSAIVCASYLGITADDGARWRDLLARQAFERACIDRGMPTRPTDTDVLTELAAGIRVELAAALGVEPSALDDRRWYLLTYVGALTALGAADRAGAGAIARALWAEPCEAALVAAIAAPARDADWRTEIGDAFAAATTVDGIELDRAAVAAALANRGVAAPATAIADLAAFIGALRRRLVDEDEAWARLGAAPALAFALAYIWTHLGIGAVDDERAAELIGACAPWFSDAD